MVYRCLRYNVLGQPVRATRHFTERAGAVTVTTDFLYDDLGRLRFRTEARWAGPPGLDSAAETRKYGEGSGNFAHPASVTRRTTHLQFSSSVDIADLAGSSPKIGAADRDAIEPQALSKVGGNTMGW